MPYVVVFAPCSILGFSFLFLMKECCAACVLVKRTFQIRVKVQHSVIQILKLNSSLHLSVNIDFFPLIFIRNSSLIYNMEIHIVLFFLMSCLCLFCECSLLPQGPTLTVKEPTILHNVKLKGPSNAVRRRGRVGRVFIIKCQGCSTLLGRSLLDHRSDLYIKNTLIRQNKKEPLKD